MKVLFISKMDMASVDLFEHMHLEFDVHMCIMVSDSVRRLIRIIEPDVIFVFHDIDYTDAVYSKLIEDADDIPIVVLCDRNDEIVRKYKSTHVQYLLKPVNASKIASKIKDLIKPVEAEIVEEVENLEETEIAENVEDIIEIQEEGQKKILAVDDNAQVLRAISSILKDKYNVSVAPSVQVAVKFMDKTKYDLILLDYDMPKLDGYAALQYIKMAPNLRDIPVVFLTGVSDKQRIAKVFKYMPEGYLLKPIEVDKLMQKIKDLIGE